MLTEKDIDLLWDQIRQGRVRDPLNLNNYPTVYYLASRVERRESYIDEVAFKSDPQIDIVKIKVTGISNALWELLNYKENPEEYHTESETVVIDFNNRYEHHYILPNESKSYSLPFRPRVQAVMPSTIYGCRRIRFKNSEVIGDYADPSPVQPIFTNTLKFADASASLTLGYYNAGSLNWKYREAPEGTVVDGIPFKYMTSNWFVLEIGDFPRSEHHLVNVNQKNAFFTDLGKAISWKEEMC